MEIRAKRKKEEKETKEQKRQEEKKEKKKGKKGKKNRRQRESNRIKCNLYGGIDWTKIIQGNINENSDMKENKDNQNLTIKNIPVDEQCMTR